MDQFRNHLDQYVEFNDQVRYLEMANKMQRIVDGDDQYKHQNDLYNQFIEQKKLFKDSLNDSYDYEDEIKKVKQSLQKSSEDIVCYLQKLNYYQIQDMADQMCNYEQMQQQFDTNNVVTIKYIQKKNLQQYFKQIDEYELKKTKYLIKSEFNYYNQSMDTINQFYDTLQKWEYEHGYKINQKMYSMDLNYFWQSEKHKS